VPAAMSSQSPGPAAPRRARTHRIRDGDTLPEIAWKYLGDRNRWTEILQANRDILADPEILPVGRRIRIPDEGTAPTAPKPAFDVPVDGTSAVGPPVEDRPLTILTPIPVEPRSE
jgi:phage tail protein X